MHICQKKGLHLDPQLFLDKSPIPVVEEIKFLGVIFDRKLSFVPHFKYVKKKGFKALNIFLIISNTEWGADQKFMLQLYKSLVRSKLHYGCIVYGSGHKSYFQMLDPVHNQGLWAIIKALEEIKYSVASIYIGFTDSLSCLQALQSMKLEYPLIGMVIQKCVFLNFATKYFFLGGYPAILALEVMKGHAKVGVPYNDFKHCIDQYILST